MKKRYFLVLTAGQYQGKKEAMPQPLTDETHEGHAIFEATRTREKVRKSKQDKERKGSKGTKTQKQFVRWLASLINLIEWIKLKNERRQKQGKQARENISKYSGQKRRPTF